MKISLRVMEPSFLYSSFAQAAISGEPLPLAYAEYIGQQWSDDEQDKAYWQECEEPCAPVRRYDTRFSRQF